MFGTFDKSILNHFQHMLNSLALFNQILQVTNLRPNQHECRYCHLIQKRLSFKKTISAMSKVVTNLKISYNRDKSTHLKTKSHRAELSMLYANRIGYSNMITLQPQFFLDTYKIRQTFINQQGGDKRYNSQNVFVILVHS